jgi:8-amino-7-oxononanoate synthase
LIDYFKSRSASIKKFKFIKSNSPIQGIIIADNLKAKALSDYLFNKGFFVKAILSPTVPEGTERLRICLHSFNTKEEIDQLLFEISNFKP